MARVHIESSAPTRIDLAGGTMDIWPLYLFHEGAQTLNAAISLRAHCTIAPRTDRRIVIVSEDTGRRVEAAHWSELRDNHELRLLGRMLHHFQAEGLELHTRSDSPVGAGIAGSSALNIAVCGALAKWSGVAYSDEALMQIAMNVEAQAIDVPTGVQDYRPALYGGMSAVELGVDGIRRVGLPVTLERARAAPRARLHQRVAQLRHQQLGSDQAPHRRRPRRCRRASARIRDIAGVDAQALERGDWPAVGRGIAEEWDNRKQLAPGVTTPEIDTMIAAARAAGAYGGKVCGAGGGGCLFCIGEPRAVPAMRRALETEGARVLDFGIERDGLKIEIREAAAAR